MAAAMFAVDFGPHHEVAAIDGRIDAVFERRVEARPAGPAVVFGVGREQRLPAAGALEGTRAVLLVERARSARFGAVRSQHVELLGTELPPPFLVGLVDVELRVTFHGNPRL